jgi:hypothetical protein
MALSVEAYVDVEGADDLIRSRFRHYDEFRVFWSVLSDEEKESYLLRSTEQIDTLIFTGRKSDREQARQFPRNGEREISPTVRLATVYNALGLMNEELKATSDKQMQIFKSLGAVKNLRLDQTSMRAIATAENATTTGKEEKIPIASKTAYSLLKPFRFGSFSLR